MGNNRFYQDNFKATKPELLCRLIWDYLVHNPCKGCGNTNPLHLQFDHVDPTTKKFAIADAISSPGKRSIIRVFAEIEKCDVLCANCHQEKTAKERNSWKLKWM